MLAAKLVELITRLLSNQRLLKANRLLCCTTAVTTRERSDDIYCALSKRNGTVLQCSFELQTAITTKIYFTDYN